MARKMFCEIGPVCYRISVAKCRLVRHIKDAFGRESFSCKKQDEKLPVLVYSHKSLIRRKLGNVDLQLQENKAVNLALTTPKVNGILIRPEETFSFWQLVGKTSAGKGYKEGLVISCGTPQRGIGGGLCQFTNLLHWMVLHSPLTVTELHHHDQYDLFPDFGRQVPFGTGTSIMYNYLDYRVKNNTALTFQIMVWVTDTYLCGELRCNEPIDESWHIACEEEFFSREGDTVYRNGKVYRQTYDKKSGVMLSKELLRENHAKVMYDTERLEIQNR
ncbi:MAG: VanW family protein [Lachnospiraceae bacterium]